MKANEYQCAMCQEIFEFGWSEEEAAEEAKSKGIDPKSGDVVCDDCYKLTPWGKES